jgi:predicted secreted protein
MRKTAAGLAVLALLVAAGDRPGVAWAGTGTATESVAKGLILTEADKGKTFTVSVGQDFTIQLQGTKAQTGWEYGEALGPEPVKIVSQDFLPAKDAADRSVGTYVFKFKAQAEGTKEIVIRYVSPGGPNVGARLATQLIAEFNVTAKVVAAMAAGAAESPGQLRVWVQIVSGGDASAAPGACEPWIVEGVQPLGSKSAQPTTSWVALSGVKNHLYASEMGGRLIEGRADGDAGTGFRAVLNGYKMGRSPREVPLAAKAGERKVIRLTDYPGAGNLFAAFQVAAGEPAQPEKVAWGEPVAGLKVALEVESQIWRPGEKITLRLSAKNVTDKPIRVLKWSAQDRCVSKMATEAGKEIEVGGGNNATPPILPEDFAVIPPGKSEVFTVGGTFEGGRFVVKTLKGGGVQHWPNLGSETLAGGRYDLTAVLAPPPNPGAADWEGPKAESKPFRIVIVVPSGQKR